MNNNNIFKNTEYEELYENEFNNAIRLLIPKLQKSFVLEARTYNSTTDKITSEDKFVLNINQIAHRMAFNKVLERRKKDKIEEYKTI